MPLKTLPPKPDNPVIDSGHFLEFLKSKAVNVDGDTVIAMSDGSVQVDTLATKSLDTAWAEYVPLPGPPEPAALRDQLTAALASAASVDDLKAFLATVLIPAMASPEER